MIKDKIYQPIVVHINTYGHEFSNEQSKFFPVL